MGQEQREQRVPCLVSELVLLCNTVLKQFHPLQLEHLGIVQERRFGCNTLRELISVVSPRLLLPKAGITHRVSTQINLVTREPRDWFVLFGRNTISYHNDGRLRFVTRKSLYVCVCARMITFCIERTTPSDMSMAFEKVLQSIVLGCFLGRLTRISAPVYNSALRLPLHNNPTTPATLCIRISVPDRHHTLVGPRRLTFARFSLLRLGNNVRMATLGTPQARLTARLHRDGCLRFSSECNGLPFSPSPHPSGLQTHYTSVNMHV